MGACNSVVWFGGGESQRSSLSSFRANSAKAQCTGKPPPEEKQKTPHLNNQRNLETRTIYKGAIDKNHTTEHRKNHGKQHESTKNHTKHFTATHGNQKDPSYENIEFQIQILPS